MLAIMPFTHRNPTATRACPDCGHPFRVISGQLELLGSEPLFVAQLHDHDGERSVWTAFLIGLWEDGDGSDGSFISLTTVLRGDQIGSAITNPPLSFTHHALVPRTARGVTRAEVFARDGAAAYFFRAMDLVCTDREIFEFITGKA